MVVVVFVLVSCFLVPCICGSCFLFLFLVSCVVVEFILISCYCSWPWSALVPELGARTRCSGGAEDHSFVCRTAACLQDHGSAGRFDRDVTNTFELPVRASSFTLDTRPPDIDTTEGRSEHFSPVAHSPVAVAPLSQNGGRAVPGTTEQLQRSPQRGQHLGRHSEQQETAEASHSVGSTSAGTASSKGQQRRAAGGAGFGGGSGQQQRAAAAGTRSAHGSDLCLPLHLPRQRGHLSSAAEHDHSASGSCWPRMCLRISVRSPPAWAVGRQACPSSSLALTPTRSRGEQTAGCSSPSRAVVTLACWGSAPLGTTAPTWSPPLRWVDTEAAGTSALSKPRGTRPLG